MKVGNVYDKIAENYYKLRVIDNPEGWFYNEMLDIPTTLRVIGNIKNKKVLDLGCGIGIYAKIMSKRGANVKGIDISKREIEIAQRINPAIEFTVGSAENLPYKNNEFDIVISALVVDHLNDWKKMLNEVKRVLKKDGAFVFSTGNPVTNCISQKKGLKLTKNYFKEGRVFSKWHNVGEEIKVPWYHKTYGTIVKLLIKAGFQLEDYEDAFPIKKSKRFFPKQYAKTSRLPYFATWKWRKL